MIHGSSLCVSLAGSRCAGVSHTNCPYLSRVSRFSSNYVGIYWKVSTVGWACTAVFASLYLLLLLLTLGCTGLPKVSIAFSLRLVSESALYIRVPSPAHLLPGLGSLVLPPPVSSACCLACPTTPNDRRRALRAAAAAKARAPCAGKPHSSSSFASSQSHPLFGCSSNLLNLHLCGTFASSSPLFIISYIYILLCCNRESVISYEMTTVVYCCTSVLRTQVMPEVNMGKVRGTNLFAVYHTISISGSGVIVTTATNATRHAPFSACLHACLRASVPPSLPLPTGFFVVASQT